MRAPQNLLPLLLLAAGLPCLAVFLRAAWLSERHWARPRAAPQRPAGWAGAQDVAFHTADGLRLQGWHAPSRNGAAVVLVHGLGQTRAGLLPEAEALRAAGFGVLLFDSRSHGGSEGDTPTWGDRERLDVRAALAFARSQPGTDPGRVGLLGFSVGASTAALVAAEDARVPAVALLSPFTTLRENAVYDFRRFGLLSRAGALLPYVLRGVDLDAVRPIDALARIHPRPVWMLVGEAEHGQDMAAELFAATCPPGTCWKVPGAAHGGFAEASPEEYPRRLRAFFERGLAGAPAPAAAAR
jgi:dienelactone hydrolase